MYRSIFVVVFIAVAHQLINRIGVIQYLTTLIVHRLCVPGIKPTEVDIIRCTN